MELSWLQSELHTSSPVVTLGKQSYIGMKGPCPKFWSHSVLVEHFFEVQTNLGSYESISQISELSHFKAWRNQLPAGWFLKYTQTTNLFPARMTLPGFAKGLAFRNSKPSYRRPNLLAPFVRFWWTGTTNMETTVGWMRFFFFTKLRDPVSSQMCLVSCSILPPWNSISLVCVCQPRGQAWSSWTRETGRWSCWGLEARAIWKQKPWIFELTVVHHFNLMSCLDWFHPLFRKSGWNNTYCIHDTWFVWILRKIPPNLVKSSWFQLVEVGVFVG